MKVTFRTQALYDLKWWNQYYRETFPEGKASARQHFELAKKALSAHPDIGRCNDAFPSVREFLIPRTPFVFMYVIEGEQVVVLRVYDSRSRPLEKV